MNCPNLHRQNGCWNCASAMTSPGSALILYCVYRCPELARIDLDFYDMPDRQGRARHPADKCDAWKEKP